MDYGNNHVMTDDRLHWFLGHFSYQQFVGHTAILTHAW